ncbi:LLM class flavin-dependent oxidoreductase [soil metagenome]
MTNREGDLEILGLISTQYASETHAATGPLVDRRYIDALTQAHEYGGFDRVLIGYASGAPDGFQIAAYAAAQTRKLKFLLAHRPGVIAPTVAARQLATLDQLSEGRLAVHIISGGSDLEQQRDGDYLSKDERYARTDEYIGVLKQAWTSATPFSHHGAHYRFEDHLGVKPLQQPHIPIFFGGSSEAAIQTGARHADVYAMYGETLDQAAEIVGRVRAAAARHGRADHIRFSMSLRPILGRTEKEAWSRAEQILEDARLLQGTRDDGYRGIRKTSEGAARLRAAASAGKVHDKRLWTEIAGLTGTNGNSTSLVGTPDQVVDSLLDYYAIGISKFLIRGFDPLEDAIDYGRNLLPRLREALAVRHPLAVAAE